MKEYSGHLRSTFFGAFAILLLLLLGCGGGGGGGGTPISPTVRLTVQGAFPHGAVTTAYGTTITIGASVANSSNQQVTFSMTGTGNAKLSSSGDQATFSAGTTTATYTITVTAAVNGATQTLTINVVAMTISISPKAVTVNPGGQVLFSAIVQGSSNTAATFSASAGTLTPVSGSNDSANYTAPNIPGQYSVTAKAAANSSVFAVATVTVTQVVLTPATVSGTILDTTGATVSGVVVQFFDSSGSQVASATTDKNGNFSASVPVSAVSFNLSPASIPNTEYKSFFYAKKTFDPTISGCNAPLPTLTSGSSVKLASVYLSYYLGPPPPPPDGCS